MRAADRARDDAHGAQGPARGAPPRPPAPLPCARPLPALTCAAAVLPSPQHEIYAIVRNAMEIIESCGLVRELRFEAVRKVRANGGTNAEVIALSEDGWLLGDEEWVQCAGGVGQLATKVKADEEGRVKEVDLSSCCRHMKELPASVGRLQALQKLNLYNCSGLTSLPAEVGNCVKLEKLDLEGCTGLTSLPDLSGLEKLQVYGLPEAMQPWKERGRKAFFALPTEG